MTDNIEKNEPDFEFNFDTLGDIANEMENGYSSDTSFSDIELNAIGNAVTPEETVQSASESKPAKAGSTTGLIVGGTLLMLSLVGALGFVGYKVLIPNSSPRPSMAGDQFSPGQSSSEAVTSFGNAPEKVESPQQPVSGFEQARASVDHSLSDEVQVRQVRADQTIEITSGVDSATLNETDSPEGQHTSVGVSSLDVRDGERVLVSDEGSVTLNAALSDEEMMYDNLLSRVEEMDVPIDAISIDQDVVQRRLSAKKIDRIEREINESRQSIQQLGNLISTVQGQVQSLGEAIEGSTQSQAKLAQSVTQLEAAVSGLSKSQRQEIDDLRKDIRDSLSVAKSAKASAEEAIAKAESQESSRTDARATEPVAVAPPARPIAASSTAPVSGGTDSHRGTSKPSASPSTDGRAAPVIQHAVLTTEQAPKKVIAAAPLTSGHKPQSDNQSLPAACPAGAVSANWAVKGVNSQSAYVMRKSDRQGLFVKEGVAIPGFGVVTAFNPDQRIVCTTHGIVSR